jgi:hypothetical protein
MLDVFRSAGVDRTIEKVQTVLKPKHLLAHQGATAGAPSCVSGARNGGSCLQNCGHPKLPSIELVRGD